MSDDAAGRIDQTLLDQLIATARNAAGQAYCPYSNFPVGAAVLAESGKIYAGCNIENASYGLTNCAERTAIFNAVAAGERQVQAVAIYTPTPHSSPPCGACRQVISEFGPDCLVVCSSGGGQETFRITDLLPRSFGPHSLESPPMDTLDVTISSESVDPDSSIDLQSLATEYRQSGIAADVTEEKQPSEGKDGGLTAAIALGGLLLTGVNTFIGVLNLWLNSRPKYTAKLTIGGVEFVVESRNADDLKAKLQQLPAQKPGVNRVRIELTRK